MSDQFGPQQSSETALFSPRVILGVLVAGAALFASTLYFMGQPDPVHSFDRHGARPTSTSAIGYRALVLLLRDLGYEVEVSGHLPDPDEDRLVIITDQEAIYRTSDLVDAATGARKSLVILPKWHAEAVLPNPFWVHRSRLVEERIPLLVFDDLSIRGSLTRPSTVSSWDLGPLPARPDLQQPQLFRSSDVQPVVTTDQGIFLGRLTLGRGETWLLSDPDLLSNHGLKSQSDPEVSIALLDHILESGRSSSLGILFVDVTLSAVPPPTTAVAALFRFPTTIITILVVIGFALACWAATARFGRPRSDGRAYRPGKQVLVENAAGLLRVGGHHANVVRRYFEMTVSLAARRLHAPRGLDHDGRFDWLCRQAERHGVRHDGADLKALISRETAGPLTEARALALARHCNRWKGELLHGLGDDPGDR